MPRIRPVERESADAAQAAAYDDTVRVQGRITNMKRTLLYSRPAFRALMEWYPYGCHATSSNIAQIIAERGASGK
jgi:hypothetical protein